MLDSYLDIGITATSIVAFAVSAFVDYAVDAIFGIVVSIIIIVFGVLMVADNLKGVVIGDKCEEEKNLLEHRFCEVEGVERVGKITVHDYGFAHKAATVEVVPKDFDQVQILLEKCQKVADQLQDEEGISAQIVLKERVTKQTEAEGQD